MDPMREGLLRLLQGMGATDSFSAMRATLPPPVQGGVPRMSAAPQAPPPPPPTIGREPGVMDAYGDPQQYRDALEQLAQSAWRYGSHPDEAAQVLAQSGGKALSGLAGVPQALWQLPGAISDAGVGPVLDAILGALRADYGSPTQLAEKVTTDPIGAALDAPTDPTDIIGALTKLKGVGTLGASVMIPGVKRALNFERELPALLTRTGRMQYEFRPEVLKRFEELLRSGAERPADWASTDQLLSALGGDRDLLYKWHRGWGATSPGTDFVQNTREANRALARYLEGEGFDWDWMGQNRFTNRAAKQGNLNRAYHTGEPLTSGYERKTLANPAGIPIIAKVNAMADFMAGNPRIPIDRHAMDATGLVLPSSVATEEMKLAPILAQLRQQISLDDSLARGALTTTQLYDVLEDAYMRGLRRVAPNADERAMFAQLWEGVRSAKGLPYYGGTNEVLDRMGLFTPGGMLDPANLYSRSVPFGGAAGRRAAERMQ